MSKQDQQNIIIVAGVAGILAGFILSMLLGVFRVSTIAAVPGWLQGVSGMVAVIVSVYAVYLVSKTLQATQDTLIITRTMAEDQRKIGEAQTRAWVLVNNFTFEPLDGIHARANIVFRNFGNTPAVQVGIQTRVIYSLRDDTAADDEINQEYPRYDVNSYKFTSLMALPSGKLMDVDGIFIDLAQAQKCEYSYIHSKIEYTLVHSNEVVTADNIFYIYVDCSGAARLVMR